MQTNLAVYCSSTPPQLVLPRLPRTFHGSSQLSAAPRKVKDRVLAVWQPLLALAILLLVHRIAVFRKTFTKTNTVQILIFHKTFIKDIQSGSCSQMSQQLHHCAFPSCQSGLLLLVHFNNSLGNVLPTGIAASILLVVEWAFLGIYRNQFLDVLEGLFVINIAILLATTL